ncbi:MAG TPA: SGNH/GDSL hydrolase family protein [Lacibacter sp.]|nr:SGNH/GDSL hydrolase family protein [Lacibacter sp.]HMO88102.1 SGNH/GDSL hydrolase family protein [Lacibacter sp.]
MRKNLTALLFGLLAALLLCELVLRIYNPVMRFNRQGSLIWPAQQEAVFHNKWIGQLDEKIHYSRNALGFRGPLPTDSINRLCSVICIGGSTTECRFLSDADTWPYLLGQHLQKTVPRSWVNNAGMDGHSTFGHQLLVREYIVRLRPRFVLLLTGVNDVETERPESFDLLQENKLHTGSPGQLIKSLLQKTATGATLFQLYSIRLAYRKGLIHKEVNPSALPDTLLSPAYRQEQVARQQAFLPGYRQRLQVITNLCREQGITPILLTQPSLYGAVQDRNGNDLRLKYLPGFTPVRNNLLQEQILEQYNDVVRSFAGSVPVVDLARLLPKDPGLFYDFIHFNKQGAAAVAAILAKELAPVLQEACLQ